jgi:hypothetical protein
MKNAILARARTGFTRAQSEKFQNCGEENRSVKTKADP